MSKNTRTKKEGLLEGINKTAEPVKKTLGYYGKTILIDNPLLSRTQVTKDGVTVAKAVVLEDDIEALGSDFIKSSANRTVHLVGDGTTTTTILTQAFCNGVYSLQKEGYSAREIKTKLKADLEVIKDEILKTSLKVKSIDDIKKVASISSNSDEEITNTITAIYEEVGKFDVTIDVVESDSNETSYEILNGYNINNTGYVSPAFINDFSKERVLYSEPLIYVMDGRIDYPTPELSQIIELSSYEYRANKGFNNPIVILCEDIAEAPLRSIVAGLSQNMLKDLCIIRTNLTKHDKSQVYQDACAVLGSVFLKNGMDLTPGRCEKIIIEKNSVTFINGEGDTQEYLANLKKEAKQKTNEDWLLNQRIIGLDTTACQIRVGGNLQSEIQEKKDRYDDAVLSVKTAIEHGYNAGAGSVFIHARRRPEIALNLTKKVLLEVYNQLMKNAEIEPYYHLAEIDAKGINHGFNLATMKVENLIKSGVVDSTYGLIKSIENSINSACVFADIDDVVISHLK